MIRLRGWLHHQLHVGAWPDGRLTALNVVLIFAILVAVGLSVLATEPDLAMRYHEYFLAAEIALGVVFLLEYGARIFAAAEMPGPGSATAKRWAFIRSPLGLVDLFVVLVSLAPMVIASTQLLRVLRLLRILSVMKFGHFNASALMLFACIRERAYDLLVCLALAFVLLLLGSTAMYWIEGETQPEAFGSIPRALWWGIITLTTVGYGDAYPVTAAGRMVGAGMAICGVLLVAMPTGIIAAAFSDAMQRRREAIARSLAALESAVEE